MPTILTAFPSACFAPININARFTSEHAHAYPHARGDARARLAGQFYRQRRGSLPAISAAYLEGAINKNGSKPNLQDFLQRPTKIK